MSDQYSTCPKCREQIKKGTTVCPHCKSAIASSTPPPHESVKSTKRMWE